MINLNEIKKATSELEEIAIENETNTDCITCRYYYTATDEDIARCHYYGYAGNMPCVGGNIA